MDQENIVCLRCGAQNCEPGNASMAGTIVFVPDNTKFFSLLTSSVKVKAWLCVNCGHIELIGDIKKAKKIIQHKKEISIYPDEDGSK